MSKHFGLVGIFPKCDGLRCTAPLISMIMADLGNFSGFRVPAIVTKFVDLSEN